MNLASFVTGRSDKYREAGFALRITSWVVAAAGVFWLPWYFGATTPVNSESYVLGFNNRVAVLALAAALAAAIAGRLLAGQDAVALNWLERRLRLPEPQSAFIEYGVFAAWTVAWLSLIWSWGTYLADPGWGDARIFHHDMNLIAFGQVPYRDFMWNYGPAMLYLPYWLSWITAGDISFERAYLIVFLLFNALGYAGVFLILRTFNLPATLRPVVLALALLAWAAFTVAMQYSSLRFVVVPAVLVLMHEAVRRDHVVRRGFVAVAAAAAAAIAAPLAISPEMAISAAAAIAAYAFVLFLRRDFATAAAIMTGSAVMLVLTVVLFPAYFLSVLAFSSGQMNFPIYPNLTNVTIIAASMVVIPALIASAMIRPSDRRAPLAMAMAVAGGMLLPAAFGRADPGHVIINGAIPALLMFPAASAAGRAWLRCWMVTYAIVLVGIFQISSLMFCSGYIRTAIAMRQLYDANPGMVVEWKAEWDRRRARHPLGNRLHWGNVLPFPKELDQLTEKGPVIQIGSNGLGDEWNCWLGRYLLLQPDAPCDYFHPWTQGAVTHEQMARRIEACRKARYLLIPEAAMGPLAGPVDLEAYARHLNQFLSQLHFFPVHCAPKHEPFQPETEMAKMLLEDFTPIGRFQFFMYAPFIVCERKSPP